MILDNSGWDVEHMPNGALYKGLSRMSKNWQVFREEKRDPAWLHQAGSEEGNGQMGQ